MSSSIFQCCLLMYASQIGKHFVSQCFSFSFSVQCQTKHFLFYKTLPSFPSPYQFSLTNKIFCLQRNSFFIPHSTSHFSHLPFLNIFFLFLLCSPPPSKKFFSSFKYFFLSHSFFSVHSIVLLITILRGSFFSFRMFLNLVV